MRRRYSAGEIGGEPIYKYPTHLKEMIDGLPRAPGVYIFYGENTSLPLYIGKSVNIRARVLSHLRNEMESRMLLQARKIDHIRTAGDIGAQLLESKLIKEMLPLHNKKLRRTKRLYSVKLIGGRPVVVASNEENFSRSDGLFGIWNSNAAALRSLHALADKYQLCTGVLGLEKTKPSAQCFRASIKRCAGACCGMETVTAHNTRLVEALEAMKIHAWPYPGRIGIVEQFEEMRQIHVIDHWHYIGSFEGSDGIQAAAMPIGFDSDGYKILVAKLINRECEIIHL